MFGDPRLTAKDEMDVNNELAQLQNEMNVVSRHNPNPSGQNRNAPKAAAPKQAQPDKVDTKKLLDGADALLADIDFDQIGEEEEECLDSDDLLGMIEKEEARDKERKKKKEDLKQAIAAKQKVVPTAIVTKGPKSSDESDSGEAELPRPHLTIEVTPQATRAHKHAKFQINNYEGLFDYFSGCFYNYLSMIDSEVIANDYYERMVQLAPMVFQGENAEIDKNLKLSKLPAPALPFARWTSVKFKGIDDQSRLQSIDNITILLDEQKKRLERIKQDYLNDYKNEDLLKKAIDLTEQSKHSLTTPQFLIPDYVVLLKSNKDKDISETEIKITLLSVHNLKGKKSVKIEFKIPGIEDKIFFDGKEGDINFSITCSKYKVKTAAKSFMQNGSVIINKASSNFSLSKLYYDSNFTTEVHIEGIHVKFQIGIHVPIQGERLIPTIIEYQISPKLLSQSPSSQPLELFQSMQMNQGSQVNTSKLNQPLRNTQNQQRVRNPPQNQQRARNPPQNQQKPQKPQNPPQKPQKPQNPPQNQQKPQNSPNDQLNQLGLYLLSDQERKQMWGHDVLQYFRQKLVLAANMFQTHGKLIPPAINQQFKYYESRIKDLEKSFEEGKLTPEQYIPDLEDAIKRETELLPTLEISEEAKKERQRLIDIMKTELQEFQEDFIENNL